MKTLSILSLLFLLTNCSNSLQSVKFGERCTAADEKQLQEKSFIWFVSKSAAKDFNSKVNKANCIGS